MSLKHMKLLVIASYINLFLGIFLIICGIVEITGLLKTDAATAIETAGIRLSYLVFVSGVLVFIAGLFTLIKQRTMENTNMQIIIGSAALAWPIFVSIALFFAQRTICIRLLPTMLSSLFYMISIMIVKITNESLRKVHKFNPSAHIDALGKRKSKINVANIMNSSGSSRRAHSVHRVNVGSQMGKLFKSRKRHHGSRLYSGSRRRGGIKLRSRYK